MNNTFSFDDIFHSSSTTCNDTPKTIMTHWQQPTPSTDTGPYTTPLTSTPSGRDFQESQESSLIDRAAHSDQSDMESDARQAMTPAALSFLETLMKSNEAHMKRNEKLMEHQEKSARELSAKEDTIAKLKSALEREKHEREKLEGRIGQMLVDQAAVQGGDGDVNGVQYPLDGAGLGQGEAPPALSDHAYDGDLWGGMDGELFDLEQTNANLIEIKNDNAIIAEYDHLENANTALQDDEYFREFVPEAMMTYTDDLDDDPVPFRKKRKADTMTNELYNLQTSITQHFPNYVFRPLIRSLDQSAEYGHLEDLHPAVHQSLQTSLQTFHARIQRPRYANHARTPVSTLVCCGHLWMTGCISSRAWTLDSPGKYTCKTCFNSRRACFLRSHGEWVVLPLPPSVRDAGATYRDEEYYIYRAGGATAKSFPDVWEEGMKAAKARERREVKAASEAGWSEAGETPEWMIL